ncbi:amidase domain-containing protein [Clostridium sp. Ade.TY]|uniref:amidase domain-containing protein n=1 Tax=Clostridium sp. Ade.TY TaxID=1391647 RepID=UPI001FA7684D|nr:amidase domain-containing protein [Clostridium sp. Ade.TY]
MATFSNFSEDDSNKKEDNPVENTPSKEEMNALVKNIFITRSKATLTKDLKGIESLYDTSTKYGKWAYEYEEKKVKYIDNWAKKQGVEFTLIKPNILIKKSTIKKDEASFAIICNTEYNYIYKDIPKEINKSKIGTYHYLKLIKNNNKWSIVKEWYKDPFADSLKLESLKTTEITKYINEQNPKNLKNLNERRKGAIHYAKKYCGLAHDTNLGLIYNKNYKDFNSEGGDCANFASQILYEGGKFSKNATWNYDKKGSATAPWINAGKFTNYMLYSGRASLITKGKYEQVYKLSFKLLPGDFIAYEKKGDITHVSVITGLDSKGYPLVTCHNTDRNDVPWDLGWSDKNMKFWIIRVHY